MLRTSQRNGNRKKVQTDEGYRETPARIQVVDWKKKPEEKLSSTRRMNTKKPIQVLKHNGRFIRRKRDGNSRMSGLKRRRYEKKKEEN